VKVLQVTSVLQESKLSESVPCDTSPPGVKVKWKCNKCSKRHRSVVQESRLKRGVTRDTNPPGVNIIWKCPSDTTPARVKVK